MNVFFAQTHFFFFFFFSLFCSLVFPLSQIPPRHFATVSDPVIRNAAGVVFGPSGEALLRHGDEEIRFAQEPFPLYPGEKLSSAGIVPLQVVSADCALRLRAIRDIVLDDVKRVAGDEWMFNGPGTYIPRVEVQVVEVVKSIIIARELGAQAARASGVCRPRRRQARGGRGVAVASRRRVPARRARGGARRHQRARAHREEGAAPQGARRRSPTRWQTPRKAGDEWLVTMAQAPTHIPDVHEKVVGEVSITTLTSRQYCVICDPVIKGVQQLRPEGAAQGRVLVLPQSGRASRVGHSERDRARRGGGAAAHRDRGL
jgi:major vault protein